MNMDKDTLDMDVDCLFVFFCFPAFAVSFSTTSPHPLGFRFFSIFSIFLICFEVIFLLTHYFFSSA